MQTKNDADEKRPYILIIVYICYLLWLRTDCQITLTQQLPLALRSVALT
jgi:hypothetical protein